MTNPKVELREYLNKLIKRFLFISEMKEESENMTAWMTRPDGINALQEGASFFNLVQRSFDQTLLIELCKFIDEDEDKSLLDFLNKAKECAKPLEPTRYNLEEMKHEIISERSFCDIIDKQLEKVETHSKIIKNLKARRHKVLAHSDASFFNNPNNHYEKYPLLVDDINQLIETLETILNEQGVYLLKSDIDMKIKTTMGIDRVLEFMRAYYRIIQEDNESIKYRWDNYDKDK